MRRLEGLTVKQTGQRDHQVEDDPLMSEASTGHRDDALPVELMLSLLLVFPGEEAIRRPCFG
jgi:hypothetical protein